MKRLIGIAALALGALAGACSEHRGTTSTGSGGTQVLLTDGPFPFDRVAAVNVHIVRVEATTQQDTTNLSSYVTLAAPDRRFDLLSLQQGTTTILGEADVPAGQYRAMRVVIATDKSDVVLATGAPAHVTWPVAGEITLYAFVEHPLDITGAGDRLVIDFDVGRSFLDDGFGGFIFSPVIRVVNEAATGTIAGTVQSPVTIEGQRDAVENASIEVSRTLSPGDTILWVGATGHTDIQGRYRVAFLTPGSYAVRVTRPGMQAAMVTGVQVGRGATATVNFALDVADLSGLRIEGGRYVAVGRAIELLAVVSDAVGNQLANPPVTWTLYGQPYATLAPNGDRATLTGVAQGWVEVVASSGALHDSAAIYVAPDTTSPPPPPPPSGPVATLELPSTMSAHVGDSLGISATLRNAAGQVLGDRAVSWTTSDTQTVAITWFYGNYATLRALRAGTASITATSEGKSGTATVTVGP